MFIVVDCCAMTAKGKYVLCARLLKEFGHKQVSRERG